MGENANEEALALCERLGGEEMPSGVRKKVGIFSELLKLLISEHLMHLRCI